MLAIPESGISPYRNEHTSDMNVFCDWLEGSLLFTSQSRISLSDIKDILMEEHFYAAQDKAAEWLAFAWRELDRRKTAIGKSYPIEIENLRITRAATWRQSPAYSFCLLLSYADRYKKWSQRFGKDFTEQGLLFEQITAEALRIELAGWNIHATGWSSARAAGLKAIVTEVCAMLGEGAGDLTKFPKYKVAKDAGLDVVMFRPFSDNRTGFPLYLVQCASGAQWGAKRHQPNIDEWKTFIDFAVVPKKALAIPFALPDDEFWWNCRHMNGMLIDRMRLLSGGRTISNWIPAEVKRRAITWMLPRVQELPLLQ
jgi:hypothetical protein